MEIIKKLRELKVRAAHSWALAYGDYGITPETAEYLGTVDDKLPALLKIAEGSSKFTNCHYSQMNMKRVQICRGCFEDIVFGEIKHKEDCPVALIEQGLEELEEAGK